MAPLNQATSQPHHRRPSSKPALVQMNTSRTMSPRLIAERVHSCRYCQAQEIDPDTQRRDWIANTVATIPVRYRGSTVVNGASHGCAFFLDSLNILDTILTSYEYDRGHQSTNFVAANWIYELSLSSDEHGREISSASGVWSCAEGELPDAIRMPTQRHVGYVAFTSAGMSSK